MDSSPISGIARKPRQVKAQTAMEYLTTYGWAILIVAIALAALAYIGLFGRFQTTSSCLSNAGYICSQPRLSAATGNLIMTIGQSTGRNWQTANIIFVPSGTPVSSYATLFTTSSQVILTNGLASGSHISVQIPVNTMLTGAPVLSVGQKISGSIVAEYIVDPNYASPRNPPVQSTPYLLAMEYMQSAMLASAYYTHFTRTNYFTDLSSSVELSYTDNSIKTSSGITQTQISFSGTESNPIDPMYLSSGQTGTYGRSLTRSITQTISNSGSSLTASGLASTEQPLDIFLADVLPLSKSLELQKCCSSSSSTTSTISTTTSIPPTSINSAGYYYVTLGTVTITAS